MKSYITEKIVRDFVRDISDQHYPLSNVVIATSAAQAVALGEACMQISLDNQIDTLDWHDATSRIEQMVHIKNTLMDWADQIATTMASHDVRVTNGNMPYNLQILAEYPTKIAHLSLEAITLLQDFRPFAFQNLKDKLNVAVQLLVGTAKAAISLLECNLQEWPTAEFSAEYQPVVTDLKQNLQQHTSVNTMSNL